MNDDGSGMAPEGPVGGGGDWMATTTATPRQLGHHIGEVSAINTSSNGSVSVSGDEYSVIKIWDVKSKQLLKTIKHNGARIYDLRIDNRTRHLWVVAFGRVSQWDLSKPAYCRQSLEWWPIQITRPNSAMDHLSRPNRKDIYLKRGILAKMPGRVSTEDE